MHYEIVINDFEGPLDLLLHLIKKSNIDIYEVNLVEITDQYLKYIKDMEEINLDIASEYLVMAAELIEIKSKALLPKQEIEEDKYEENNEEDLINRLVEYKKYKEVTETFKDLENLRKEIYTKTHCNYSDYVDDNKLINSNITLEDLVMAINKFLERKALEKPLKTTVTNKEYSVTERIKYIKNILKQNKKATLYDLFEDRTKSMIVVTFLSILEMVKTREIIINQENNFENVYITLCEEI